MEGRVLARAYFGMRTLSQAAAHRMPGQKRVRHDSDDADDPLFRALRQLADEALEEEIPERFLRLIRAAERQHEGEGERPETQADELVKEAGKST
jgi:hypothetical protein